MEQVQTQNVEKNNLSKRQTAHMFWISDIKSANIDTSQQYPSFIIKDKTIIRINLIAVVTTKYLSENGSYATLGLDDGTGMIIAKSWNEDTMIVNRQEVGNIVLVIGKLGFSSSKEVYVRPEIIRQIEMPWLLARKKDLESKYGIPTFTEKPSQVYSDNPIIIVEEEILPLASKFAVRAKILELLNSSSEGLDEIKIAEKSGYGNSEISKAVSELVREGEIYYSRHGILKGL